MAIAEWPTEHGPADFSLRWTDLLRVAELSASAEILCRDRPIGTLRARGFSFNAGEAAGGPWGSLPRTIPVRRQRSAIPACSRSRPRAAFGFVTRARPQISAAPSPFRLRLADTRWIQLTQLDTIATRPTPRLKPRHSILGSTSGLTSSAPYKKSKKAWRPIAATCSRHGDGHRQNEARYRDLYAYCRQAVSPRVLCGRPQRAWRTGRGIPLATKVVASRPLPTSSA